MKAYIGTKIIRAKPMTRKAYNDLRGWTVPEDENPADDGFLVEYLDGGSPNVAGYDGYVSWSPRAPFEKAYLELIDQPGLEPHEIRVAAEKMELDDRRALLLSFIKTSDRFNALSDVERLLLTRQLTAMDEYSEILGERMTHFNPR